ncbi:MAG: phosphate ABC transporter permease subunit PstC [Candidatus Bathyarchaeia archaeon]
MKKIVRSNIFINKFEIINMKNLKGRIKGDDVLKLLTGAFANSTFLILALIVFKLTEGSWLSIQKFGLGFLIGTKWDPALSQVFGALPLILGTTVTSTIALVIGVPLSIGVALVLSEYMPRRAGFACSFVVEMLAAIPSVIYGLWGIFTLAPFLRDNVYPYLQLLLGFTPLFSGPIYGGGVLTGGIILAIMIVPTISSVSRDVFSAVPSSQREAILALGATRWETVKIVMSYARSGIIGAIILGLGRAVGETMAITMIIGNKFQILPSSLFDAWYTLAAIIANEFTEATYDLYVSALIEVGLVLFLVTFIINVLARVITLRALGLMRGLVRECDG